jgi:hypothetical protein
MYAARLSESLFHCSPPAEILFADMCWLDTEAVEEEVVGSERH